MLREMSKKQRNRLTELEAKKELTREEEYELNHLRSLARNVIITKEEK
jgi:hypothetical protein